MKIIIKQKMKKLKTAEGKLKSNIQKQKEQPQKQKHNNKFKIMRILICQEKLKAQNKIKNKIKN